MTVVLVQKERSCASTSPICLNCVQRFRLNKIPISRVTDEMACEMNEILCVAIRIAIRFHCLWFGICVCTKYRWENVIVIRFVCTLG
jgi:hypothetical protein